MQHLRRSILVPRPLFALLVAASAAGCAAESPDAWEESDTLQIGSTSEALSAGDVDLIAIGSLDASGRDRSAQTGAALENGRPGNLLGGMGSGLAYAGGSTFLAVPDRGPNAVAYNSLVDDTTSFIDRFHTLHLRLAPSAAGAALPFVLSSQLRSTTLFHSRSPLLYGDGVAAGLPSGAPALNKQNKFYFVGRSDNFDPTQPSTSSADARLDPESIRVSNDGESVYISDEYGPFVYEFERGSGRRTRAFELPASFAISALSSQGDAEIAGNASGRVTNKGMEGLAITPDGETLIGAMQSPLLQDGATNGRFTRLVSIAVGSGETREFAYELTNIGSASKPKFPTVSDIVAINDHELLVDERDGKGLGDGSTAVFKRIYRIDLAGATDVSGLSGEAALAGHAVTKTLFLDVVATFNAHGIASNDIPAKLEGLAFGPDVVIDGGVQHTLFLTNDNDFIATVIDANHPAGIANPNQFFVFKVASSALPTFVAQDLSDGEDSDQDE